ncbi:MAG: hypothetical protein KF902_10605 [Phycisphaeraceae bacterium]|nr:hypothetical protein [Phycisphaeraceae bacterium]MBX3362074.1 hypothetical protein [Phycisphaeraceae bacterium]MBX3366796.1 hypothetical protein [Phycisphaeraceae bacterium]MCW5767516.1 hypothetical protein [Phycisphaeraceae bacterium]QYK46839.1 MAG: hypothetical protein KF838_08570 [Phycisphaeraceae bacterium]
MPFRPEQNNAASRSVRITLASGKHRWTFECDQRGRDALDTTLQSLVSHSGLSFCESDALIVRRAVAESLGLVPQIRQPSAQDHPPTGR